MARRGNQRVGRTTRALIAITIGAVLIAIVIGIYGSANQRATPDRGSSNLPTQAEQHQTTP